MKILAKTRYYLGAFIISSIVALIMIPLLLLMPSKHCKILHYFNKLIIFLLGGKIEVVGKPDPKADILLINHQGIIDIVSMEAASCQGYRWVAKKELFDTPWFGKVLQKSDMISINRQNKSGLIKLIKDVKESIEIKHRKVVIFPEGTRADGQELLPFKAGTKLIANKLKLKVQPVVITGSKRLLNEHNRTAHNSTVKITYLDTIDTQNADEEWYDKVAYDMQHLIDNELIKHNNQR